MNRHAYGAGERAAQDISCVLDSGVVTTQLPFPDLTFFLVLRLARSDSAPFRKLNPNTQCL